MGNNIYMGQIYGPFEANKDLFAVVEADAAAAVDYITHLGIQTKENTIVYINNEPREVGKTGMYEIGNTKITSVYFKENTDNNSLIDYCIIIKD